RDHILRGEWGNKERPVLLNSWEASYFNISEGNLVSLAKAGRDLGIELFVMDDGWFGERSDDTSSLGDWDVNLKKLPGGLSRLSKKVTDLGIGFGLWVEPEMINVNSRLYEAHPDWAMAIKGKLHSEGRHQRILDLSNPEVSDWMIEKMSEVFSSGNITYVKWDMNRIFSDVYSPYLPPKRQGETAHRYMLGLYKVMKALTERFPHILFEGCASGGCRFDLGILCYFPQIWGSDNTDALCRSHIQEGYSYGYPQCCIGAHVSACPNHQTLRSTPLETRFNIAAFGALGYELNAGDMTADDKEHTRLQITLYKVWRDVLQYGDFYRIRTGENRHQWIAVSEDKSRAVGMFMQELVQPDLQSHRFVCKGLDPDRTYRFHNISGKVNIKLFGSLINTMTPIHIRQDGILHNLIARFVKMGGEVEDYTAKGSVLMGAGVALRQQFSGNGYNENVRLFPDFASRMYFIEAID
ncbi:MAG: alpha-galactosidase, partial [Ruminococcus sp.]|nr:alpha-galactosidase [Ruminococcus sp.]